MLQGQSHIEFLITERQCRFQDEFKDTSDSEYRASTYWATGKSANRPVHISSITCTLIEVIGACWVFSFSHKGYTIIISPSGLEPNKGERKWKKIGVHEHTADVPWKPCPLPEADQEPWAQGSRCNHFSSSCFRRGELAVGLAGSTAPRGSNRMYTPKRLRPGGVLTERAEDFLVHRFSKLSARTLHLKNSPASPLCLLYSKVRNVIVDVWWPP